MSGANSSNIIKKLCRIAVISAVYAVISLLLPFLSYGTIQLRIAEALCVLPILMPESVFGVFFGCLITNIFSGSVFDLLIGSAATLIAAYLSQKFRAKPLLAALFPVVINALVIGIMLSCLTGSFENLAAFLPVCALNILSVGIGEGLAVYGLGIPLLYLLKKYPSVYK